MAVCSGWKGFQRIMPFDIIVDGFKYYSLLYTYNFFWIKKFDLEIYTQCILGVQRCSLIMFGVYMHGMHIVNVKTWNWFCHWVIVVNANKLIGFFVLTIKYIIAFLIVHWIREWIWILKKIYFKVFFVLKFYYRREFFFVLWRLNLSQCI